TVAIAVRDAEGASTEQRFQIGVPGAGAAPTVAISSPTSGSTLEADIEMRGTVSDADLLDYEVFAQPIPTGTPIRLLYGESPVTGALGTLAVSRLTNRSYDLRLVARDAACHVS